MRIKQEGDIAMFNVRDGLKIKRELLELREIQLLKTLSHVLTLSSHRSGLEICMKHHTLLVHYIRKIPNDF